ATMRWIHLTVIILLGVATLLFVLQNREIVAMSFLGFSIRAPLAILIAAVYAIGEAQLHERLAAAEQSIATARSAAMTNVKTIAPDSAAAIVERLIGRTPSEEEIPAAWRKEPKARGPADT